MDTRSDWRSCKLSEAIMVQAAMNQLTQFEEDEQEEMASWTLYGQFLLQKDPYWLYERFPLYPPEDMEHFQEWYKKRLLWIRYGRYYAGDMSIWING